MKKKNIVLRLFMINKKFMIIYTNGSKILDTCPFGKYIILSVQIILEISKYVIKMDIVTIEIVYF